MKFLEFIFTKTPLFFLTQSLWRDEAFSILLSQKSVKEIIYLTAKDFNPPLYYLLLKLWMGVFGRSEIVVRSLSFIIYALSIYIFFELLVVLEKRRLKNLWLPVVVFATSPIILYYAFEARMYSLLYFFTLVFYYALFAKKERLWKTVAVLGCFTHYFFLFNLLAVFVSFKKEKRKKLFVPFVLFVPWLIFVFFVKASSGLYKGFWIKKLSFFDMFLSPFYLWANYDKNWEPLFKGAILISLFLIFCFIISLISSNLSKSKLKILLSWLLLPFLLSVLISLFLLPIFLPRYLIFIVPSFVLLISFMKNQKLSKLFLVVLLSLNLFYNFFLVKNKTKVNWKKELFEVRLLLDKNTLVYITNPEDYPVFAYYLPEDKVFIFYKTYDIIPDYVGKIVIPKEKTGATIPIYPKQAILIRKPQDYIVFSIK